MGKCDLKFTKNQIIRNGKELINLNKFFYDMDDYLDYDYGYYVEYDEENNKYKIEYRDENGLNKLYEEVSFDPTVKASTIKRLMNLAITKKMIKEKADFSNVEDDQDINDAKEYYLKYIKKKKLTVGMYISRLFNDLKSSINAIGDDISENFGGAFLCTLVCIIVASIAIFNDTITSDNVEIAVGGRIWLAFLVYPSYRVIRNYITLRIRRLKKYLTESTIKNSKIKEIELSLSKANELSDTKDFQLKDNILKMINELTDKLAILNPMAREPLRVRLDNIFNEYKDITNDETLSYTDRILKRKDIITKIGELEADINVLRPSVRKNITSEVNYVQDRLNNLDEPVEEVQKRYMKA